jgi:hypothetical protein
MLQCDLIWTRAADTIYCSNFGVTFSIIYYLNKVRLHYFGTNIAIYSDYSNETSGSIKREQFLDQPHGDNCVTHRIMRQKNMVLSPMESRTCQHQFVQPHLTQLAKSLQPLNKEYVPWN